MLVNTVRENFEGYLLHEVEKSKEGGRIQGMIANPTEREFAVLVREQLLTLTTLSECLVLISLILGGKQLGQNRNAFESKYVQIPRVCVQLHKYIMLVADVMFVNGLPFLVTSSRGSSLVTIEHLPSRTAKCLVKNLERVFRIYSTAGFFVQMAMMEMEVEKLKPLMPHCDNIHPWISTTGDLAFSHQQEFTVLNSQKGFWRSFPEISLFCLFCLFCLFD